MKAWFQPFGHAPRCARASRVVLGCAVLGCAVLACSSAKKTPQPAPAPPDPPPWPSPSSSPSQSLVGTEAHPRPQRLAREKRPRLRIDRIQRNGPAKEVDAVRELAASLRKVSRFHQ